MKASKKKKAREKIATEERSSFILCRGWKTELAISLRIGHGENLWPMLVGNARGKSGIINDSLSGERSQKLNTFNFIRLSEIQPKRDMLRLKMLKWK